ncbi:acetylcholinesterase-like [Rhipicephalus sanguineus]|uniref:acetylcholinesterase-like n=1 Tax=Rhipicephalus sanguineus TaxID=34632 RepID=UPI0018959E23|nr:acetylcholinesterase-like [Rhipicephalus sanguineus]
MSPIRGSIPALSVIFVVLWSGVHQHVLAECPPRATVVVNTSLGNIRGLRKSVDEGELYVFTGIPFAEAPIGNLRYRKPQPARSWQGNTLDATALPPSCTQVNVFEARGLPWVPYDRPKSEDCLYLNIWTPALEKSARLPVMAWLHGGVLQYGSAAMHVDDGSHLASRGNVVVVTIAYRLQSFGFLYDGTDDAPGNQGLHDQVLALKWIQKNIQYFGGDPHEVTLFGWSAGGTSIAFHMTSPDSKDLFRRAIIQSGDINDSEVKSQSVVFNSSRDFAGTFGCNNDSFVSCMRQLNATLISVTEATFVNAGKGTFKPIYGDTLLPVNPLEARYSGDKDVIIGHVANEGTRITYISFRDTFSQFLPPRPITKPEMIHYLGVLYSTLKLPQIFTLIETYMKNIMPFDYAKLRHALTDAVGDSNIDCPSLDTALKLADSAAAGNADKGVYFYVIDHPSRCSKIQPWFGTTHGDDIALVFGRPLDANGCTGDISFSKSLIKIWTDFAKGR